MVLDICKFKSEIKHVHLKDKNFKNKNVIIGKGEVKFKPIFEKLKKINISDQQASEVKSITPKRIQLGEYDEYLLTSQV